MQRAFRVQLRLGLVTHQVSIRSSLGPELLLVFPEPAEPLPEPLEEGITAPSGMDSSRFMLWCAP